MRSSTHRRTARRMTAFTLFLQAATLGAFLLDPSDPPRSGNLWQVIWALFHQPAFIPLLGLLLVGPPATLLAASVRGRHRTLLLLGWGVFILITGLFFPHRVAVMLKILFQYKL